EEGSGPALVGFVRPVIVIPRELVKTGSRSSLEHVVLHELAHYRRLDPWMGLGCLILQIVYWFHPFVWMARRRVAMLLEICCDRTVTEALSNDHLAYRCTILELARPLLESRPVWQLGFITPRSQLMQRLDWLSRTPSRFALFGRI